MKNKVIKKIFAVLGLSFIARIIKNNLRILRRRYNSSDIFYLNIGAGGIFFKKNWRILEYSGSRYKHNPSLIDFDINLFDNLAFPIADNSVDLIYCSHTFEHLHDDNVVHILNESYRILKRGGGENSSARY